jgi:hypothetical protein
MDAPDELHEPEELPRSVAITIIGETALDHLHEVAQHMQENIVQVLAEDSEEN